LGGEGAARGLVARGVVGEGVGAVGASVAFDGLDGGPVPGGTAVYADAVVEGVGEQTAEGVVEVEVGVCRISASAAGVAVHVNPAVDGGEVALAVAIGSQVDHASEAAHEEQTADDVPALAVGLSEGSVLKFGHVGRLFLFLVLASHCATEMIIVAPFLPIKSLPA